MKLRISEIFSSVQGEGIQMGLPMTFIRLAGCNLRCEWCDTKYSWEEGMELDIFNICEQVTVLGLHTVCITGGEPMIQNITGLLDLLGTKGYKLTVETNGTIKPTACQLELVDLWTASPKIGHWNEEALKMMSPLQLKIVVIKGMSLDISHWRSVDPNVIVLQPCAEIPFNIDKYRMQLKVLAEFVRDNKWSDVRVLPQMHKLMYGDRRGV